MREECDAATPLDAWLADLECRHLANLRFSEVTRALRAVSSAYVERRDTALADNRVLDGAGKRAAFAMYYGPLHYLLIRRVLDELAVPGPAAAVAPAGPVIDLGCGTGPAGAAVAQALGATRVTGIDTNAWTLEEAKRTYRTFGLDSTLTRGAAGRGRLPAPASAVVAAFLVNELDDAARQALLPVLLQRAAGGTPILIVEPISRRVAPWWPEWATAFAGAGGRADEWKLRSEPPSLVKRLGHAAGLKTDVLMGRTIWTPGLH